MNILQIGTIDKGGGAAKVSWDLKEALRKDGHTVNMFVSSKHSNDPAVKEIPRFRQQERVSRLLANDITLYKTGHILKTQEFKEADIVHCHNLHGYYFNLKTLMKMSKIKPVVWTLHDMWAITADCAYAFEGELKNGFYQCPSLDLYPQMFWHNEWYLRWRKKNVYKKSNFNLVTPSKWLQELVSKSILKDKETHLIYNGIDSQIFTSHNKKKIRQELSLPGSKKIILFLSAGGITDPRKGGHHVVEIAKHLKEREDVLFLCVGSNEKDSSPTLKHIPYIADQKVLAKYFASADLFLFPSLADNLPLVVLEAMSCGLPVVSYDVGGVKEVVIDEETGFIAKYDNQDDLQKKIKEALNAKSLKTMGQRARAEIVENFTINKMTQQYLNLYKKILSQ